MRPTRRTPTSSLASAPAPARGLAQPLLGLALAALLTLAAYGCGSSGAAAPAGLIVSGPGVQEGAPPWHPEYAHLAERVHMLGLPKVGNEKFHIHAMLHIYVEGLLVPLPADIGIDQAHHIETSLHTHDGSGIIHMETTHRFPFTLGDFFTVWGVKLGPAQVGSLKGLGGARLHFYLNGRPLSNPAAYVMHNGDSIVVGYGADDSFPHTPSTQLLKELEEGKGNLGCSAAKGAKKGHSCLAPQSKAPASKTSTHTSATASA